MAASTDNEPNEKKCFVVSPIGETTSTTRVRADKVFRHVIQPAVTACGYATIVRSDMDPRPGMIGSQIINHLLDDDLVVADLTDHNPNVFYELAIRHAVQKPTVQIIQSGQRIPFDVSPMRTIELDHSDLDSAANCREQLERQIQAVEKDPTLVDSPISHAVKLKALEQSSDPEDRRDAQLFMLLESMSTRLDRLSSMALGNNQQRTSPIAKQRNAFSDYLLEEKIRERLSKYKINVTPADISRLMDQARDLYPMSGMPYGDPVGLDAFLDYIVPDLLEVAPTTDLGQTQTGRTRNNKITRPSGSADGGARSRQDIS